MTALNLFNDGERIFNFDAYKNIRFQEPEKKMLLLRKNYFHLNWSKLYVRLKYLLSPLKRSRGEQKLLMNDKFGCLILILSLSYPCVKSKLEKLQGHKVVAVMSHKLNLLLLVCSEILMLMRFGAVILFISIR